MNIRHAKMSDLGLDDLNAMRALSFGDAGTMQRWTYQDGSTWASICYEDVTPVAWSCLTLQDEPHAVVGVFVALSHRGRGIGSRLIRSMLETHRDELPTSYIYAVGANFKRYSRIIGKLGLVHLEWI